MGQCAGMSSRRRSPKTSEPYWKQPADTQKLAGTPLQKLQFQGTLANFKIVNCDYDTVSVRAEIKGVETFLLRPKQLKSKKSANWAFQHKFEFQMTEYQLRKSFIEIFLLNQQENIIGDIKLNLYLISCGPYHQNFSVQMKKGQNTRIYFDLKISQIIEIELNSIKAQIDLFTKHPGQKFRYSIKTIVGHNTALNVSSPSYTVRVKLDDREDNQNSETLPELNMRRKSTVKLAEKEIPQGHNLIWTTEDYLQMPSIVMKTLVSELHHCYFQLLFWKIFDKAQKNDGEEVPELFGECYVALHKIFDTEPVSFQNQGVIQQKRIFTSDDKLWHHGKQIGKGFFKFQVNSDKYIKQMQVMVRTQEGIMKYSPVFFNDCEKGTTCEDLNELVKISEQIEQSAIKLDSIKSQQTAYPSVQSRKLKISIQKLLQRLLTVLQKSSQTNTIMYSYSSPFQLMRAQQLFLNLGFKILGYLSEEDVHINDYCWQILIALLQRGEFVLAHVGFDMKQKNDMKSGKMDSKLQRKIQIALTYHEFLSKLLKIAVDSLNLKGLQLERSFAQMFCAYAYFRIPNFRNAILEAITRPNDPQLPQWRVIQFSLQDDIDYDQLKQQVNTFTALFDWSDNFHKCIEHIEKYQVDANEIYEVLVREDWKFRMSKRGITFFQFIKCWVEYVESIVVKPKDIQWKYFPGYSKLLKCFLAQMKKRPILQYPDILKSSLFKLLANQKLLNPIIVILYNKANIYQPLTVIRAIVFISQIFAILSQKNKKIPATFNYFHFYQGIKVILQSQFSFAISKTIVMLYNYFKMFPLQFRRNMSMFLFGKVFFRLFLHWSYNVRDVFYHLVMKLYHESLRMDTKQKNSQMNLCQEEANEEIRGRYVKLMSILEKGQNQKRQMRSFRNLEKDLHKRLKSNLLLKRKQMTRKFSYGDQSVQNCPDSPMSQIIDKSLIYDENYKKSISRKETTTGRSQSQTQKPVIKLSYKMLGAEKETQIKALNNKDTKNFKHQIYDNTQGQRIRIKTSINDQASQYVESDFQIPKLEPHLLQYIDAAMRQFKKTNQIFTQNFNNKNWELPKIQMQMPLDSKQIRPQKIDDW